MPLHELNELTNTVASYLVEQKVGDLNGLGTALAGGHLNPNAVGAEKAIDDYLSKIADGNEIPYIKWSDAYMKAIYVSQGEFDPLMPHK